MLVQWASLPYPTQPGQVGGHEGVGKVVKLGPGSDTSTIKVGDRVGVKWVRYARSSNCFLPLAIALRTQPFEVDDRSQSMFNLFMRGHADANLVLVVPVVAVVSPAYLSSNTIYHLRRPLIIDIVKLTRMWPAIAQCMAGADALCPKAKISGYYTPGTFQQYCIGPVK